MGYRCLLVFETCITFACGLHRLRFTAARIDKKKLKRGDRDLDCLAGWEAACQKQKVSAVE